MASCCLLRGPGGAMTAPQPPQLPCEGLKPSWLLKLLWPSRAGASEGENEPLPQPLLRDAGTVVTVRDFCSSALYSLPAKVHVDGAGWGSCAVGQAAAPMDGAGQCPCGQGMLVCGAPG